jgi:hypothetical protein
MDKKTIYIVVAVIVVVLIVGVAGVMLLNNGGLGGTPATTPTPTPVPTPTTIVGADTSSGVFTYTSKNFNTSTEIIRVDMNIVGAGNYSYIIDMAQSKSWTSTDGGSHWTASAFAGDVTNYATPYYAYVTKIAEQANLSDFAYTSAIQISCITVNPTIADSFFATS